MEKRMTIISRLLLRNIRYLGDHERRTVKHSFTKTVLLVSVCAFAHGARPVRCATNETASVGNTNETTWTISKEGCEIEEAIAKAPEVIFSMTNNVREYTSMICEKIVKCPVPETRYRYFRKLMESACQVDFVKIVENVPEEKMPDESNGFLIWSGMYGDPKLGALWDAYRPLRRLADDIWENLAFTRVSTPCAEQFEPYFKLIEKLKTEERRLEKSIPSTIEHIREEVEFVADRIEYHFHFLYLQHLCKSPDPQDLALFKARFERVVGRPVRSLDEYEADSRRRMDEIIKRRKGGL